MILFENPIAIVACVKNESRYIEEWLDYHYRIGVDKFYIYDNDSEDRSKSSNHGFLKELSIIKFFQVRNLRFEFMSTR